MTDQPLSGATAETEQDLQDDLDLAERAILGWRDAYEQALREIARLKAKLDRVTAERDRLRG